MASKYKVVIIEDEKEIQELIETTLMEGLNFPLEILMFDSGEAALANGFESKCHLVVADFKLPGINGLQLINEIRKSELNKSVPVIFISGFFADLAFTPRSEKLDNVIILDKPFDVNKLARKVRIQLLSNAIK